MERHHLRFERLSRSSIGCPGSRNLTVKKHLVIALNLRGFLAALPRLLAGETIYVLDIGNRLPIFRPIWNRIFRFFNGSGRLQEVDKLFPTEERYFVQSWMPEYPDLFAKLESGIAEDFGWPRFDRLQGYTLAIKHAACQYAQKLTQVTTLKRLSNKSDIPIAAVVAIDRDVERWYRQYFGAAPAMSVQTVTTGGWISAILTTMVLILYSWVWTLRRIRRRPETAPVTPLGADFVLDNRTTYMVSELTETPEDVLFVYRNSQQVAQATAWKEFSGYRGVDPDELTLSFGEAWAALGMVLSHGWRLLQACHALPADLYFQIAKLPHRRLVFRTLLARRPMGHFLSRDDYNTEHIIRTDELRRAGTTSLGIAHGMTTPGIVDTRTRYVDYDTYFVFGRYPFPEHYAETWPQHMKYVASGSFGMTREQFSLRHQARPPDILFFISRLEKEREFFQVAVELAHEFPDRNIVVKPKYRPHNPYHFDFASLAGEAPENLAISWDDSYALMLTCRYAISNGSSSVAAEAIQYGVMAYVWDDFQPDIPFYYRAFPEICVERLDQFTTQIRKIEDGRLNYPWERLENLIDLSGKVIYDVIRQEMGLPARAAELARAAVS